MSGLSYYNFGQAPLPLPADYALAGPEPDVLAVDFSLQRMTIRDRTTPANNFHGDPAGKLTVSRASGGGRVNGAGLYEWSATQHTIRYDHDPLTLDSSTTTLKIDKAGLKRLTTTGAVDYRNASLGWMTATNYVVGDRRYNAAGRSYVCVAAHTSGASTEPGVGGTWRTVWARSERSIRVSDTADLANYLLGSVDSHVAGVLVLSVSAVGGSGTKANWHIIESLGARLERQHTNRVTGSAQLTTGWSANGTVTKTLGAGISPDGTMTAARYEAANAAAGSYFPAAVEASQQFTFSVYIKYLAGTSSVRLGIDAHYCSFNTATGAVITSGGNAVGYSEPAPNGFRRYVVTGTNTAIDGQAVIFYNHTAVPLDVLVWGAQVEYSPVASSYIPTTASQVSRAMDALTIGTSSFPWSDDAGSTYAEFMPAQPAGTAGGTPAGAIGRTSTGRPIYIAADNTTHILIYDGTSASAASYPPASQGAWRRGASSWGAAGTAIANAGAVPSSGSYDGSMGTGGTLFLGSLSASNNSVHGVLRRAKFVPRQLTGTDLQKMSLAP